MQKGPSFRTSPLAMPDAYDCIGNVGITVPAVSGLLANDFDDNPAGLTATAGTFATCDGRMSNPYTSLAAFNAANDGPGLNPADNDNLFIYENATIAYTGSIVLRNS